MAGAKIQISFRAARARRHFREAAGRARDMREAWEAIGERMLHSIEQTFAAEGRPDRWDSRKNSKSSKPILVKSSRLRRRSLTYRVLADGVEVGTNLVYAATHQFGRDFGRGAPIPARPFLQVLDEDERMIAETIEDYLTEVLQ